MSETVNQGNNATNSTPDNGGAAPKTFTQAEMDTIIAERLNREREKYKDFDALKEKAAKLDEMEAKNKSDLEKANDKATKLEKELESMKKADSIRAIREKVAKEKGIPANLLNADTEEACTAQADAILEFKGTGSYPSVQDGGEAHGDQKSSTAQQFADWIGNQL